MQTCPASGAVERRRSDAIAQRGKEGEGVSQWSARKCKRGRDARVKQVGFIDKLPLDFFFFLLVEHPEFHLSIHGGTTDGK